MKKYLTNKEAMVYYSVCADTLRNWDKKKLIETTRTKGGDRRYVVEVECKERVVCYCRVSSYKQKDDLERQVNFMQEKYPEADTLTDIGSGLNFKRKGLKTLLEYSISGGKQTVVAAYKDRLGRFATELLRWIIEHNGGELVVLDQKQYSPEDELTKDLLSILHVFSCRLHGLRSYKNKVAKAISVKKTKEDI